MLKRLCSFLAVLIVPFFTTFLPKDAMVCYGGKSSGTFESFSEVTALNFINRNGVSLFVTSEEATEIIGMFNAKKVHYFKADGVENYYFYTDKIAVKEVVFNKRINLHLAVSNGKITLGSPIIYYGY